MRIIRWWIARNANFWWQFRGETVVRHKIIQWNPSTAGNMVIFRDTTELLAITRAKSSRIQWLTRDISPPPFLPHLPRSSIPHPLFFLFGPSRNLKVNQRLFRPIFFVAPGLWSFHRNYKCNNLYFVFVEARVKRNVIIVLRWKEFKSCAAIIWELNPWLVILCTVFWDVSELYAEIWKKIYRDHKSTKDLQSYYSLTTNYY